MATRSTILARHSDGRHAAIYLGGDGYPSSAGSTPAEHYTTQDKIDALIALGDLSSLDARTDAPVGHSYERPAYGCCVAYGRDRGEDEVDATWGGTAAEALKAHGNRGAEYLYTWDGERWTCSSYKYGKWAPAQPLADAIAADAAD